MPLILGTNSIKDTGYDVANSLRFDSGSSDFLNRTPSSSSNRKTFTFSFWIKRTKFGVNHTIYNVRPDSSGANRIHFHSADTFRISLEPINKYVFTKRVFRDPSSWYHFVLAFDTTQSTASDRVKIYINGVQETELVKGDGGAATYPDQDTDLDINRDVVIQISKDLETSSYFVDGYLAEFVFIDGTALDQTSFGQFDSDSPTIWKPKDVSGLTFGTNGFYLDFQNASSLGADVSGNSNNFTVNNLTSVDQSTDTCTNNYATFNSLLYTNATLSEGNLQAQSPASGGNGGISTFGASKGKWYAEFKQVAESTANEGSLGVIDTIYLHTSNVVLSSYIEYNAGTYGLRDNPSNNAAFYTSGGSVTSTSNFHGSWATNDIIGIALDIDNNKVYFSKNGQWTDGSGNWDESNPTGYLTIQSTHGEGTYMFAVGDSSSANNVTWQANFGSPPFSISSGNSDANGYGNFEYSVPSGYYALNTKNLAEFG